MTTQQFKQFGKRARQLGQGMTEYIIITAVIAIAAIGVFTYFGQTAQHQVGAMAQELSGTSGHADMQAAQGTASQAHQEAGRDKTLHDYHNGTANGNN